MASLLISVTIHLADLKFFSKEIDSAPEPVPSSKKFLILIFLFIIISINISLSILGQNVCLFIFKLISLKYDLLKILDSGFPFNLSLQTCSKPVICL